MVPPIPSFSQRCLTPRQYVCQCQLLTTELAVRVLSQSHVCRCDGEGRVSYMDCKRKEILKGSSLQSSAHVILRLGRSHFVQKPWKPFSTAFDICFSSSQFCTSAWTMSRLFLALVFPCEALPSNAFSFT